MALIKEVARGANGWNTIYYTDGTKYIGNTKNDEIPNGYGTLYAEDGSVLERGVWEDNILMEPLDEHEYSNLVNKTLQYNPHW